MSTKVTKFCTQVWLIIEWGNTYFSFLIHPERWCVTSLQDYMDLGFLQFVSEAIRTNWKGAENLVFHWILNYLLPWLEEKCTFTTSTIWRTWNSVFSQLSSHDIFLMKFSGVPRNFVRWGGSTNSAEDRGQRERGSGGSGLLVRGSGDSCNLVFRWGGLNPPNHPPRYATDEGCYFNIK
jgi:hypothetical protein